MTEEQKREQGRQNRLLGRWGEALVVEDLRRRGWSVLGTGFRTRFGELDIIASDGRYLAFIEVKLRKTAAYGTGGAAVDLRKRRRLQTTAEIYLSRHPTRLQPRFDVAEVYAPQGLDTPRPEITYIEDAF